VHARGRFVRRESSGGGGEWSFFRMFRVCRCGPFSGGGFGAAAVAVVFRVVHFCFTVNWLSWSSHLRALFFE
jgi:hypothetical protein